MRKLFLLAMALFAAAGFSPAAVAADTVFVMRHLQKADGSDPPLSPQGAANAQALAELLATSGIKTIFATPTRRAMQTGRPLAARLGFAITPYSPGDPDALVKAVDAVPGAVLIVGHSNTVPDLVARFGGKQPVTIGDEDYGTVFVVKRDTGSVSEMKISAAR